MVGTSPRGIWPLAGTDGIRTATAKSSPRGPAVIVPPVMVARSRMPTSPCPVPGPRVPSSARRLTTVISTVSGRYVRLARTGVFGSPCFHAFVRLSWTIR